MSNFHKQKAEAKAKKKLVFSQESLDAWKSEQKRLIEKEAVAEVNRRIKEANEALEKKLAAERADMTREALDQAFTLMIGIPVRVLKNKYGWGSKKRLPEFAEYVQTLYQEFSEGDMSIYEYQKLVWEETGIGFVMREEGETVDQAVQRYDSWIKGGAETR